MFFSSRAIHALWANGQNQEEYRMIGEVEDARVEIVCSPFDSVQVVGQFMWFEFSI